MTTSRVGLIGVGAMGAALLARRRLPGMAVRAYDVSAARPPLAGEGGAEPVATPEAAARDAAYVHVFVASDEQVLDCCLGADGALATAAPGAVVFLHSTILPATTRRV